MVEIICGTALAIIIGWTYADRRGLAATAPNARVRVLAKRRNLRAAPGLMLIVIAGCGIYAIFSRAVYKMMPWQSMLLTILTCACVFGSCALLKGAWEHHRLLRTARRRPTLVN